MDRDRRVSRRAALIRRLTTGAGLNLAAACAGLAAACAGPSDDRRVDTASRTESVALARAGVPDGAAYAVVDLTDGRTLQESGGAVLDTPVQPGSLMKVATLAAAVEAGIVDADTRLLCPRRLRIDGHVLDCAHPDLGRPLSAAEALAFSCNGFFAHVGARLSTAQLSAAVRALGLPPLVRRRHPVLAALGLDDYRVAPRAWLPVVAGAAGHGRRPGLAASTLTLLAEGLAGAARVGTASASTTATGDAIWAKTGTAPMPGGGVAGLAVLVVAGDSVTRGVVVVAPGAAGRDAAAIGGDLLRAGDRQIARQPVVARLRVGHVRGGRHDVRELTVEDYVGQVVAAEATADAPAAARRALAVVARTYALRNRGRHVAEGFDVCDLTHCQALRASTGWSRDATSATADQVLFAGDALADVYYSASCGGVLATVPDVWPQVGEHSPRVGAVRRDPAGSDVDEAHWSVEIDAAQMRRILLAAGLAGDRLDDLVVLERHASGRVKTLRAAGFRPDTVAGETFRIAAGRAAGWYLVKSTWFEIARTGSGFRLTGRGHGHGVGMCVRGAAVLARTRDMRAILDAYFPGTRLASFSTPAGASASDATTTGVWSVKLVLPPSEDGRRAALTSEITRLAESIAGRLGERRPRDLSVRFHPTVESYQRSTGKAWWTAGSVAGARVDLLPLTVLDARGQRQRTLRHELVHALTIDALAGRPLWVKEGVAHFFAGPAGVWPPDARDLDCPDDGEFERATSGDMLRQLYDRSALCVGAALAQGRTWRELP